LGRDVSRETFHRLLAALFLAGLLIRAGYLLEHARNPSFAVLTLDQKYYDTVARMLLAGADLRALHGLRPLLYPIFLAGVYKVGGSHGIDLALVTQHFLGVLTGLLAAMLGARLFRHRLCGLAGGALYLLAPLPLCFEGELLIESSYTFLICLALLLHFGAADADARTGAWLWLAGGAATVFVAQARANILVFLAVYPLLAAWRWRVARERAALAPLLGLLGAALMAVPWGFVNKLQSGHFQWLPNAGGANLYLGNKRGSDGMIPEQERRVTYGERYEDPLDVWARQDYESAMRAAGRTIDADPMAVSRYWTGRAVAEIRAAPGAWLRLMARKCWLTFWNAEIPNNKSFAFMQTESAWLRLLPVRWVVLLMLAPAGIAAAWAGGNRGALLILLTFAALYSAANVAFFICDRFRYPVWPAMAVLAGGGLMVLVQAAASRHLRQAVWIVASMALMAALSLPNWAGAKLPSFARDYLFQSIAWYEKGHFPEALADADRSLQLDPNDATAWQQKGNALLALSHWNDARASLQRAAQLSPDDGRIWNNLGVSLEALGQTNDAVAAFQRAMTTSPPSDSAFLQMAFLRIRARQLDEATSVLDQFARIDPRPNAMALALRAVLAQKRGDSAQARKLQLQAEQLDPAAATWARDRATKP
jgi:Flp pilus assembly protein TadD